MKKTQKIKKGDIFRFNYSQETHDRLEKDWYPGYWRHCFEGILHAREIDGDIKLIDTYWGLNGDGKSFSEKDAREKGEIRFLFNLDDVERIPSSDKLYYKDEDLFEVSEQHACVPSCVYTYKKKGVERSNEKMLSSVNEKMREQRQKVEYASDELQRLAVKKYRIEEGDLTVYL